MKDKLRKSKKGGIASTFSDFWSYVIFVFVIIIFFAFFKLQTKEVTENEIAGLETQINENTILLNYLRTQVEIDVGGVKQKINVAELIRLWYFYEGQYQSGIGGTIKNILDIDQGKYQSILKEKTNNILNLWEYETQNPYSDNIVVKTFGIVIMEEKPIGESINPILQFESKNYNVPDTGRGRLNLGVTAIPASGSKNLYIILRSGFVAKSVAK